MSIGVENIVKSDVRAWVLVTSSNLNLTPQQAIDRINDAVVEYGDEDYVRVRLSAMQSRWHPAWLVKHFLPEVRQECGLV